VAPRLDLLNSPTTYRPLDSSGIDGEEEGDSAPDLSMWSGGLQAGGGLQPAQQAAPQQRSSNKGVQKTLFCSQREQATAAAAAAAGGLDAAAHLPAAASIQHLSGDAPRPQVPFPEASSNSTQVLFMDHRIPTAGPGGQLHRQQQSPGVAGMLSTPAAIGLRATSSSQAAGSQLPSMQHPQVGQVQVQVGAGGAAANATASPSRKRRLWSAADAEGAGADGAQQQQVDGVEKLLQVPGTGGGQAQGGDTGQKVGQ
jgi:hypothetical protein